MEFRFRAGDRRSRSQTPAARFSRSCDRRISPQAGPFHGEPPLPPPFDLEAAVWRERIIRGEVERRLLEEVCLIEEEVRRELAVARARFLGVLGPVPFVGPDRPFMPAPPLPPPSDALLGPGGPFLPLGPMPLMPVGMSPSWPPFWELEGFDGGVGVNQSMLVKRRPPPRPKPKQKLKLREIKTSKSSEILSPQMKVSGVKRKADVISASTDPAVLQNVNPATTESAGLQNVTSATTESSGLQNVISATIESAGLQNVVSATTESAGLQNVILATSESAGLQNVVSAIPEPTEPQNSARYLSCAVYQVRSTSKAKQKKYLKFQRYLKKKMALQKKQEKRYLKRKMALYGGGGRVAASGAGPSDTSKKIQIVVDGEMHEVVRQGDSLWCEQCTISCINAGDMADHLRGKKHSSLNKIWRSIKAVRMKNRR